MIKPQRELRFYKVTYRPTKKAEAKVMETREGSEEDAMLQAFTLWAIRDSKAARAKTEVKPVKYSR